MKKFLSFLVLILGLSLSTPSMADNLLMARTNQNFPEAMLKLQDSIRSHGYTVSRVQRVDIGLTHSGYVTDKYRVVFFGKAALIKRLSDDYPQLIPYLPFKIAIFAEGDETLLVAANPLQLTDKTYPELEPVMKKIEKDLLEIFQTMRED
ncbi:hypothetical protein MNBD_GAMMA24-2153 [hydrothermal vent metagenome]|uniref:DUF302 domain-containing protein n=1 Tax=hydrothermal vent metagenome TaxID=652676 RepID=A0A3B1B5D8_9ZZZZ